MSRLAVLDALAVRVAEITDRPVGVDDLPSGAGVDLDANGNPQPPYSIVRLIGGGGSTRSWNGHVFRTHVAQVTTVGLDPRGALDLADVVEAGMIGAGRPDTLTALTAVGVEPQMGSPAGAERSGTLWSAVDRYEITVEA